MSMVIKRRLKEIVHGLHEERENKTSIQLEASQHWAPRKWALSSIVEY
jgi:hypothetical protein